MRDISQCFNSLQHEEPAADRALAILTTTQELYDQLALKPLYAEDLRTLLRSKLNLITIDIDEQRDTLAATKLEIERRQRKLF